MYPGHNSFLKLITSKKMNPLKTDSDSEILYGRRFTINQSFRFGAELLQSRFFHYQFHMKPSGIEPEDSWFEFRLRRQSI
jgi:hypothetical protein